MPLMWPTGLESFKPRKNLFALRNAFFCALSLCARGGLLTRDDNFVSRVIVEPVSVSCAVSQPLGYFKRLELLCPPVGTTRGRDTST